MTQVPSHQNDTDNAHSDKPPAVSRDTLIALYRELRTLLDDDDVLRLMKMLNDPFKAPELLGELRDELIQAVLQTVLPIAWREWQPAVSQ